MRIDEIRRQLQEQKFDLTESQQLANHIMLNQGFTDVDPSHNRGGPDGKHDALMKKNGHDWIMAAYFPATKKTFAQIKSKFKKDLEGVTKNNVDGMAFVTNQHITLGEREELQKLAKPHLVEIYHLDRIELCLDEPHMARITYEYLGIEYYTPYIENKVKQVPFLSNWTWYSTKESIAEGKFSLLAFAEILLAFFLFWYVSGLMKWTWGGYISLFAAPLLLLRSEKSIVSGVARLQEIWNDSKEYKYKPAIKTELGFLILIIFLPAVIYSFFIGEAVSFGKDYFYQVLTIAIIMFTLPSLTTTIAKYKINFRKKPFKSVLICLITTYISYFNSYNFAKYSKNPTNPNEFNQIIDYVNSTLFVGIVFIILTNSAYILVGAKNIRESVFTEYKNDAFMLQSPAYVLALLLRGILIRLYCTVLNLSYGLKNLPQNWSETMLKIDFCHLPELIPNAGTVDQELTTQGLFNSAKSAQGRERFFKCILLFGIAISAFIYRLSLKSSVWLWYPLFFFTKRLQLASSYEKMRDSIASNLRFIQIGTIGLILLAVWLSMTRFIVIENTIQSHSIGNLIFNITLAKTSWLTVRFMSACLFIITGLIYFYYSIKFYSSFPSEISSSTKMKELTGEAKIIFEDRLTIAERWRIFLITFLVVFLEANALFIFHYFTPQKFDESSFWLGLLPYI